MYYTKAEVERMARARMPKRLNVYDAVNKDRLLGTHPRWTASDQSARYISYMTMARCAPQGLGGIMMVSNSHGCLPMMETMTVDRVELKRETRVSKDGWEAEIVLVTYDPLEHLMRLKDFWLPGESDVDAYKRRVNW